LTPPDKGLTLTIVAEHEPDGKKAIDAAWKMAQPNFALAVKRSISPPPQDGWDATTQIDYVTPSSDTRRVLAIARRKGDVNWVMLIDGDRAAFDRRAAQVMTAVFSVHAPGQEGESFANKTAHVLDEERLKAFADYVDHARERAKVPGAAVAIVQNGAVVFQQGFGVRDLTHKEKVTPDTLFMIGSTTKSLTTLMMAELVDQGKFKWDSKVTDLMPAFALGDPTATKLITMQNTVCACAGLPRQDLEFLFEYAKATPESRVASMKAMRPTTGFGETFQYSNTMVATGGFIAAHVTAPNQALGPAYDAAMKSLVFGPLGMKSTTFDFAAAQKQNHASPNGEDLTGAVRAYPIKDEEGVVAIRPAGAAWSNVTDMARYVSLELGKGTLDGKQIVSSDNLMKRRTAQVKITDKMSYGLGLFVEKDHGVNVIGHGGNNLGFTSDLFFLPDSNVGLVLLTNDGAGANALRKVVRMKLLEILFDGKQEADDFLTFVLQRENEGEAKELAKTSTTPDPKWTTPLLGAYENESLGTITLKMDGKKAVLDAGEWSSAFGSRTEDDGTMKLVLLDPPWTDLDFTPSTLGENASLTIDTPQQKYVFTRKKSGK
ncbi:MAG: serine hydrolase domain-containing protein, partial [Polyangiaceae bacterium]